MLCLTTNLLGSYQGTLDNYETYTSPSGMAEVWYSAPSLIESTDVTLKARFPGDMVYQEAQGEL